MKILLSFVPLVLAGVAYSRGVSAEFQNVFGRDGAKLLPWMVLALLLVIVSMLIQIVWARQLALLWDVVVLLSTLLVLEYGLPPRHGLLEKSRFFVGVGIGLFVAITCGIALLLSIYFDDLQGVQHASPYRMHPHVAPESGGATSGQ